MLPSDSTHWRCGKCDHWNRTEKGLCSRCAAPVELASQFRLKNVLTAEEEAYFRVTGPAILRELRQIRTDLIFFRREYEEWKTQKHPPSLQR